MAFISSVNFGQRRKHNIDLPEQNSLKGQLLDSKDAFVALHCILAVKIRVGFQPNLVCEICVEGG
jgi:hypothetical protein